MPREFVTSQEIFDLESDRIFNKYWICIDHVSRLSVDELRPVTVGGNKLVIVGEGTDKFRAFRNFCRHRGSMLITEENCQSFGQRIQCPYHAWTYARDGSLVAAPNMEGVGDFALDEYGLIEVGCQVHGGFIWVAIDSDVSVDDFLSPLKNQLEDYSVADLRVAHEIRYEVQANWKLIFQNYSECYHCPTVHPVLNQLTPYKDSENEVESGPILGGPMRLSKQSETMSMDGKLVGIPMPRLNKEQRQLVNYYTIFPTIFLSTHPDYVLIHRLERVSVECTLIVCQFLFLPEVQNRKLDISRAIEFWDMTNQQDWKVCELAQAGMEDSGYVSGPYSNLESVLAAFDSHYRFQIQLND